MKGNGTAQPARIHLRNLNLTPVAATATFAKGTEWRGIHHTEAYPARSISDATSPPSRMTSEVTYIHSSRTMTVPSSPYVLL